MNGRTRLLHRRLDGTVIFNEDFSYDPTTGRLAEIQDGMDHEYIVDYTNNDDTISQVEYQVNSSDTEFVSITYDQTNKDTTVSFKEIILSIGV